MSAASTRTGFDYTVVHTTQGSGSGAVSWFQNEASQVSAHFVILENGQVVQQVDTNAVAWHAGRVSGVPTTPLFDPAINPNNQSLGIEFAGYADQPLTPAQLAAIKPLFDWIALTHGANAARPVAHSELSPGDRSDPGEHNLNLIKSAVSGNSTEDEMTEDQVKATIRVMLTSPEGAQLVKSAIGSADGYGPALEVELQALREMVRGAIDFVNQPHVHPVTTGSSVPPHIHKVSGVTETSS